ncbi:hypothetical protein NKH19_29320 [Mesorhizobium sp. M1338]|uniref:hypothetical protein n=1 Tax=unclassified Mesorhizobium TaxID=325217 RepID=UPI003338FE8D
MALLVRRERLEPDNHRFDAETIPHMLGDGGVPLTRATGKHHGITLHVARLDDNFVERQTVDAGNLIHRVDNEGRLGCSNLAAAEHAGAHRRAAEQRTKLPEQLSLSATGFGENDENRAT